MKTLLLASFGLAFIWTAASADQGKGIYGPLNAETIQINVDGENVRRDPATAEPDGIHALRLPAATVADVDRNRDGFISFDELLRFDVTKNF